MFPTSVSFESPGIPAEKPDKPKDPPVEGGEDEARR